MYAKWSQKLNIEIYVAYAEANGHATEALGNIRTVKAMSTELQGEGPPSPLPRLTRVGERREKGSSTCLRHRTVAL